MTLIVLEGVKSITVQRLDKSSPQDFYKTLIIADKDDKEFQIILSSKSKDALDQLKSTVS